jgi:Ca-activated chloride channel family protein
MTVFTASVLQAAIITGQTARQSQVTLPAKSPEPIVFHVTIADKSGGFATGLKPTDLEVSIDKKPAQIVSLSQADEPVSVGIVLDSSGSASQRSTEQTARDFLKVRDAIRHFMTSSNQANDYFLMAFNTKPQLLADWTSDPEAIAGQFHDLQVHGNTALYDACYLAINKLQSARHAKRALILISDGQDNLSRYTFDELRELLRETGVLLYAIHFPASMDVGSSLGIDGMGILEEFSSISGGTAFWSNDGAPLKLKDANVVFEIIATELRKQYTVAIVPNEPLATKKWHKIRVKVNLPRDGRPQVKGLSARTRDGFYLH